MGRPPAALACATGVPPSLLPIWAPGTAPLLPPPFHPQIFSVTVSVKQALCRQGLQPTQRVRKRTGGQSVVLKTNLVCFSSNTYISQLWLIHSSKSKSSSILHPFLTVQTGPPPLLLPSPPREGGGLEEGAFPRMGPCRGSRWLEPEERRAGSPRWARQAGMTELPKRVLTPSRLLWGWATGRGRGTGQPAPSRRTRLVAFKARGIVTWQAPGSRAEGASETNSASPSVDVG